MSWLSSIVVLDTKASFFVVRVHDPLWVPQLPMGRFPFIDHHACQQCLTKLLDPPDSISVAEFMSNDKYGWYPFAAAGKLFTCGLTGKAYTAVEVVQREDYIARELSQRLGFRDDGSEWDRVIGLSSLNTVGSVASLDLLLLTYSQIIQIDYIPLTHAIHRMSGIIALHLHSAFTWKR